MYSKVPDNGLPKIAAYGHSTFDYSAIDANYCGNLKPYDNFDEIAKNVSCFDAAAWKRNVIKAAGLNNATEHGWQLQLIRSDK